jgi:anti-sigma B factor antagonist
MLDIRMGDNGEVRLEGRLDAAQTAKLQEFLDRIAEPRVIDFKGLEYISSAGLGVLLKTQKRVFESSGALKLTNVSKHIGDVFNYSGLDQIFDIELVDAP